MMLIVLFALAVSCEACLQDHVKCVLANDEVDCGKEFDACDKGGGCVVDDFPAPSARACRQQCDLDFRGTCASEELHFMPSAQCIRGVVERLTREEYQKCLRGCDG